MAAILYRYAQFKEYDMTAEDDLTRFPDGDETAEWAETFVRWAVAEGLLNGGDDGTLDPRRHRNPCGSGADFHELL